ncbi:hypothetical protein FKM82_011133 [Ascaphus truei]
MLTHALGNKDLGVFNPDTSYINIKLEWKLSSLANLEYGSPWSCLDVATICIRDPVCNRYLVEHIKACSVNGNVCNVNDCQTTTRSSYDYMPFNVAQMLAFCDCAQSDEDCQHTRDVLHSKSCVMSTDPTTSCINVIRSCLEDELCRQRYEKYQSKCWEHTTTCHNDESCWFGVNNEDLTCSGNDDCKAAYIGILGTQLQMQCTCSIALNPDERHLCNLYYHMLHSKSCLKTVLARNIHAPYSDTQEKQLILTGPHALHNVAVIYIVAYTTGIILVFGIIILALLQTRACRAHQKRNLQLGNASES